MLLIETSAPKMNLLFDAITEEEDERVLVEPCKQNVQKPVATLVLNTRPLVHNHRDEFNSLKSNDV